MGLPLFSIIADITMQNLDLKASNFSIFTILLFYFRYVDDIALAIKIKSQKFSMFIIFFILDYNLDRMKIISESLFRHTYHSRNRIIEK